MCELPPFGRKKVFLSSSSFLSYLSSYLPYPSSFLSPFLCSCLSSFLSFYLSSYLPLSCPPTCAPLCPPSCAPVCQPSCPSTCPPTFLFPVLLLVLLLSSFMSFYLSSYLPYLSSFHPRGWRLSFVLLQAVHRHVFTILKKKTLLFLSQSQRFFTHVLRSSLAGQLSKDPYRSASCGHCIHFLPAPGFCQDSSLFLP